MNKVASQMQCLAPTVARIVCLLDIEYASSVPTFGTFKVERSVFFLMQYIRSGI